MSWHCAGVLEGAAWILKNKYYICVIIYESFSGKIIGHLRHPFQYHCVGTDRFFFLLYLHTNGITHLVKEKSTSSLKSTPTVPHWQRLRFDEDDRLQLQNCGRQCKIYPQRRSRQGAGPPKSAPVLRAGGQPV